MQTRTNLLRAARRMRLLAASLAASLAATLAGAPALHAQAMPDTTYGPDVRIGLYGAYELTQHDATLGTIPGVPSCSPGFSGPSGSGSAFGAVGSYGLNDLLAIQMRLGYSSSKAKFSVMEDIGNAVESGELVSATSEHTIDVELGMIDIEPRLSFTPFSFPLTLGIGAQFGFIQTATYDQKETLISPTAATFAGGRSVRNARKGDIPERGQVYVAALGTLGYDIPVSRRITVSPEISYHRGLSKIITDSAWKMHEIRLGASIKFRFGVPSLPQVIDTPPPPGQTLFANVDAAALQDGNVEQPIARMRVEEFLASQLRPLLNYVFFDDGSDQIPSRYARLSQGSASGFGMRNLQNLDVLPTYYQLLNVVGRRMADNPGANLTITGCNANVGSEQGATELSRRRAEAVRDYLRDVWNISESRLKVDARDLPSKPSNTTDPDGIAENRRVELSSNMPAILEPVFTSDTVRTTNPPTVRFHAAAQSVAGVRSWRLVASQNGRTLREFSGSATVPGTIDWDVEREQSSIPRGTQPINYQLTVTDANGQTYTTPERALTIDQVTVQRKRQERIADKVTNRFSLILFDFGKADIGEANRKIVSFIKEKITSEAKVAITGYTDRVGEEAFNQRLSEERAQATAKALGTSDADVSGVGESVLLYDNNLPEGRFYCRVVNVVVEVPVE